jgi:hypothetical protein
VISVVVFAGAVVAIVLTALGLPLSDAVYALAGGIVADVLVTAVNRL